MEFGPEYQAELLLKLTQKEFVSKTIDILRADFFQPPYRKVAEELLPRVAKSGRPVSKGQLLQVARRNGCKLEGSIRSDYDLDREEVLRFARYRLMRDALLEAGAENESGNFDRIQFVLDRARKRFPQTERNGWIDVLDSHRPMPRKVHTVPTGIPPLDDLFDGGPGAGEVCAIMAPSGGGKTAFLVWLAGHAVSIGKRVAYVTLDDPGNMIEARFRRLFAKKGMSWKSVAAGVHKRGGRLHLSEHDSGELSAPDLGSSCPDVDLLIIDYADELRRPSGQSGLDYFGLGLVYSEIRNIARDRKIPVWTASQVNRTGYGLETPRGNDPKRKILEMHHIEASLQKVMKVDRLVSFNQSDVEDSSSGTTTGDLYLAKHRHGPKKQFIPVTVNWVTNEFKEGKWTENQE